LTIVNTIDLHQIYIEITPNTMKKERYVK